MRKILFISFIVAAFAFAFGLALPLLSHVTPSGASATETASPQITLGTYATRNGFTARVDKVDCGGFRPVRAVITGDGTAYARYYTTAGSEYADGKPSPYDLITCK